MTVQELTIVQNLTIKFERAKNRLTDLKILGESTNSVLDGMPHAKPLTYKVERIATMIIECKAEIDRLANELVDVKCELLDKLQRLGLPELQLRVLNYHYVSCLKFGQIARLMHFSFQYVKKLHSKALRSLGLNEADFPQPKSSPLFNRSIEEFT